MQELFLVGKLFLSSVVADVEKRSVLLRLFICVILSVHIPIRYYIPYSVVLLLNQHSSVLDVWNIIVCKE